VKSQCRCQLYIKCFLICCVTVLWYDIQFGGVTCVLETGLGIAYCRSQPAAVICIKKEEKTLGSSVCERWGHKCEEWLTERQMYSGSLHLQILYCSSFSFHLFPILCLLNIFHICRWQTLSRGALEMYLIFELFAEYKVVIWSWVY